MEGSNRTAVTEKTLVFWIVGRLCGRWENMEVRLKILLVINVLDLLCHFIHYYYKTYKYDTKPFHSE